MLLSSVALIAMGSLWLWQQSRATTAAQPIATLTTPDIHALAWSAADANTVLFGHHGGVLRSSDGGHTWQPTTLTNADAMMVATSPADPQRIYAAGHGIFRRSDDGGASWDAPNTAIQGADIHGFAQSPVDADRLYALVVEQGLLTSADGGATWTSTGGGSAGEMHAALVVQADGTLVRSTAMGVQQSTDHGATWTPSGSMLPSSVQVVGVAAGSDTTLFAATTHGVYRRTGANSAWTPTSLMNTVLTVAVNPIQPNMVLAVDEQGGVYRSDDGGVTWGSET